MKKKGRGGANNEARKHHSLSVFCGKEKEREKSVAELELLLRNEEIHGRRDDPMRNGNEPACGKGKNGFGLGLQWCGRKNRYGYDNEDERDETRLNEGLYRYTV